jgi:hypothetical protein
LTKKISTFCIETLRKKIQKLAGDVVQRNIFKRRMDKYCKMRVTCWKSITVFLSPPSGDGLE